jgi:chitinase
VPYAYSRDQWLSYDNLQSISIKATYAANNKLGGAMVWSIESDDFLNICGDGKFPLMTAISKGLNGGGIPTTTVSPKTSTTNRPTTSTSTSPITPTTLTPSPIMLTCVKAGIFSDPANCFGYIECDSALNKYVRLCPSGLAFNPILKLCDWAANVKC